ncbi:Zinc finger RING/FYVE/PHD-type protein [Dioscorea alata]|uniref:Zinc finger RING/FYVE/PHD-type protein n=1 Tax=Dioscorea alata TaxID=55571 RepID=A0ACB7VD72_DIOAL|nr:Zinc finger RING/FYVE/PHD-type protein [Dioscorea alata]
MPKSSYQSTNNIQEHITLRDLTAHLTLTGANLPIFALVFFIVFSDITMVIVARPEYLCSAMQWPEKSRLCVLCLEELGSSARCRRLWRCQHEFHAKCIDRWLVNSFACQMCMM